MLQTATADGRQGRVFTLRLTGDDEKLLRDLHAQAQRHMPPTFGRKADALGWFIVWAAMQWKAPPPSSPPPQLRLARAPGLGIGPRRAQRAKRSGR